MPLEELAPAEAARRLGEDPSQVFLTIPEFMRAFGVTWEETRAWLSDGVLKAEGKPDGRGGYLDPHIRCDSVIDWMVITGHTFPPEPPAKR